MVELVWIGSTCTFKEALQSTFNLSGQLLKKHLSSKELSRSIRTRDLLRVPIDLVNHLQINPTYTGPGCQILRETESYIAVHKAPGVHSHPHCYSDTDTVLNFLASREKWDALKINPQSYDRGLLYRLDFETSGVIVLSKTENLKRDLVTKKIYWAIVEGSFNREGQWSHHFKSSGAKGSKQKVFDAPAAESREGSLSVYKVCEHEGKSLVVVELKTGLRHQIRAQLAHLGFPLLGDELYGGSNAQRVFLHALIYDWGERVQDELPELFHLFFDLNRALEMTHDVLRSRESC